MSEVKFLEKIQQLTKDQINEQLITHDSLWLLQIDLETHGPYHIEQLRKISTEHADELSKCMACNLKQKNWKPFFEHGVFQKRNSEALKPFIKEEEKGRHSFHILIDGQKKGPISVNKINEGIDNGEIKMTHLISADGGKSWRKIFHFPQFDRRKDAALDLEIQTPDEDHFEKSRVYSTQVLKKLNLKKEEESLEKALLACQQHLNKKVEGTRKVQTGDLGKVPGVSDKLDDVFSKFSFNQKTKKSLIYALSVILIVGLFLFDQDKKKSSPKKTSKSRTIKKERTRDTASRVKKPKPRKRSKYSSRDRTRRRQDDLDNSDLEYNQNSPRYRDRRAEQFEDEPVAPASKKRAADIEDDFIEDPDEEIALDPEDNIDMFDGGRQIALDEEIDDEYEPGDESFDDGIEDIDY